MGGVISSWKANETKSYEDIIVFQSGVNIEVIQSGQVWYGAYAGAAQRRVHLAMVLLWPLSGHRPGRRQARHARILQIGINLTQT